MNEWCPACQLDTIPRKLMGVQTCYFCDNATEPHVDTMDSEYAVITLLHAGYNHPVIYDQPIN